MLVTEICISIHALLAESDRERRQNNAEAPIFLSTLSLRRATFQLLPGCLAHRYFYPRSPCGERLHSRTVHLAADAFLSTLSLRRATYSGICKCLDSCNFYPRSPCGERPAGGNNSSHYVQFLSTLSLRRATVFDFLYLYPA